MQFTGNLNHHLEKSNLKTLPQVFKKLIKVGTRYILFPALLVIIWFLFHNFFIIKEGINNGTSPAEVGVIFGSKNQENGGLSASLLERLNIGLNLYRKKQIEKIIVTGGMANKGLCEADLMRKYLSDHGVPLKDIITDDKALNTQENVENSLEIIKKHKFKSVAIVSEYYHIARIKLMFNKHNYDFNNIETVSSYGNPLKKYHLDVYLREFLAYYYYLLFK